VEDRVGGPFEILLPDGTEPGPNLALEWQLLREVDAGVRPETLRLWVNDECLVRGPHRTRLSGWFDEPRARELGIPVYTRLTGGGCVYHDRGNLNWSFFLRRSGGFVAYSKLFRECAAWVIEALRRLGVEASFGAHNRIDVVGRKVSGLAGRSLQQATLVHGTLLVSANLKRLESLCIPPQGCPPVARICDFDSRLTLERVIESIVSSVERCRHSRVNRSISAP
jgi:lipoate-protein ligase A